MIINYKNNLHFSKLFTYICSMEIIIKPKEQDTILLSQVDPEKHILVGVDVKNRPLYFTPICYDSTTFKALILTDTDGNSFNMSDTGLIKLIEENLNFVKLAAFEKKDWKKALKWLIDNC